MFENECGRVQDTYRQLLHVPQRKNPAKLAVQVVVGHSDRHHGVSCQQRRGYPHF